MQGRPPDDSHRERDISSLMASLRLFREEAEAIVDDVNFGIIQVVAPPAADTVKGTG